MASIIKGKPLIFVREAETSIVKRSYLEALKKAPYLEVPKAVVHIL
jgi:hypothetical protein